MAVIWIPVQNSSRHALIIDWLAAHFGWQAAELEAASADASFRRYYRLKPGRGGLPDTLSLPGGQPIASREDGGSVILMDAPPPAEDLGRFVDVAHRLRAAGLNVPRVHFADASTGIALVDDLGPRTLLDALAAGAAPAPLYAAAVDALVTLQSAATGDWPPYDAGRLETELSLFPAWYLERHLGVAAADGTGEGVAEAMHALVEAATAQPQVLVHRDYHSRNLMMSAPLPGILDFQDAVRGPLTYDLVSLLRDCYVDLPPALADALVDRYREAATRAGLAVPAPARLRRDYDWMGVQRHLKVLGIFTRLWYRDGRSDYLQYLPRVRGYLCRACAPYPELAPIGRLVARLGPADEAAVARITPARGADPAAP
jgi:aminoglycoside/choline kinase family phosphotransferase